MANLTRKLSLGTRVLNYVRDPAVAVWRKAAGLAAAVYVVWPLDVIPDIPVVGWLDDIGVVSAFAMFMVREIHKHAAGTHPNQPKPPEPPRP